MSLDELLVMVLLIWAFTLLAGFLAGFVAGFLLGHLWR